MCTNRALVDSMECYMDDLIDCFEDFVKKSVIVISVAVGLLVAMIAYVLKTVTDRALPIPAGNNARNNSLSPVNRAVLETDMWGKRGDKVTLNNATTEQNEKVLKDIKFAGCSSHDCNERPCTRSRSGTRLSLSSLPTKPSEKRSAPKLSHPASKMDTTKQSCCSMCCEDNCDG